MRGYQLVFFTFQNMRVGRFTVGEWLLERARELEVPGATMSAGQSGYDSGGKFHSAHFFDLAEQPIEVLMIVTEDEAEKLFAGIEAAGLEILYSKTPVEFGVTGKKD